MKKVLLVSMIGALVFVFSLLGSAGAAIFNVSTVTDLQTALTTASANGEDDTINVAAGTYNVSTTLTYSGFEAFSLTIQGAGAGTTILDGGNTVRVMSLSGSGPITASDITFQHGNSIAFDPSTGLPPEGGGLNVSAGLVTIENCAFLNNTATGDGGGLVTRSPLTLSHNTFLFNQSSGLGGGAFTASPDVTVVNNVFSMNQSSSRATDGLYLSQAGQTQTIVVTNNTFYSDLSTSFPLDVEIYNGTMDIWNNISHPRLAIPAAVSSPVTANIFNNMTNSLFIDLNSGVSQGDNIITADPQLVDPTNGDVHLQASSPAIDAGSNAAPGLPLRDIDGDDRILNGTVDIGADELIPPPPEPDITVNGITDTSGGIEVSFGTVTVDTFVDQTVTVANDGTADLKVENVAVADALTAPFSIFTDNCSGVTLAPMATCTITVRFSPTAEGAADGSFDIPSDDPDEASVTVNVSGTGMPVPVADITVTDSVAPPDDLQVPFGSVTVGNTASATVTIENVGSAALNVRDIALSSAEPGEFVLDLSGGSSPCGNATPVLAAGASCTVTVAFAPSSEGDKAASLDISSDDPDEATVTVNVSGTGMPVPVADITVTDSVAPPDDLQVPFGSVTVGNTASATVTIENVGSAALNVRDIALSSAEPGEFVLDLSGGSSPCGNATPALAAGVSCTVTVAFAPSSEGNKAASLDISSDDPDEATVTVNVSGTGMPAPVADITVTDSVAPNDDLQVPFGTVTVDTFVDQTVTVGNAGNADLMIFGVAQAPPLAAPFSIFTDNCSGATLAPMDTCTITVRFSPSVEGAEFDSFDIPSDDPDEASVTVNVNGTGMPVPVADITVTDSVAPPDDLQVPFGNVTVGNTSSARVTIENVGSAALNVRDIALSGSDAGEFILDLNGGSSPCGNATPALAVGASCTATVAFAPSSEGVKTASLDISSDDPDEATVSVALAGTGLPLVANNPPSAPQLVFPANGQTGLATTVTFRWNPGIDPDGDPVTHGLFVCKDGTFSGSVPGCETPINTGPLTASTAGNIILYAGFGFGFLGAAALARSPDRQRKWALLLAALLLAVGTLLVSCDLGISDGKNEEEEVPPPAASNFTVSNLEPGTTFFWKVVASDGTASTPSETRTFSTQ